MTNQVELGEKLNQKLKHLPPLSQSLFPLSHLPPVPRVQGWGCGQTPAVWGCLGMFLSLVVTHPWFRYLLVALVPVSARDSLYNFVLVNLFVLSQKTGTPSPQTALHTQVFHPSPCTFNNIKNQTNKQKKAQTNPWNNGLVLPLPTWEFPQGSSSTQHSLQHSWYNMIFIYGNFRKISYSAASSDLLKHQEHFWCGSVALPVPDPTCLSSTWLSQNMERAGLWRCWSSLLC